VVSLMELEEKMRTFHKTLPEATKAARAHIDFHHDHVTVYPHCQRCGNVTYAVGPYGEHQRDVDYCAHCDQVLAALHRVIYV